MMAARLKVGETFGRLTLIELPKGPKVRARCECGRETMVRRGNLRRGNTKSCGCGQIDGVKRHARIRHAEADELRRGKIGEVVGGWRLTAWAGIDGSQRTEIACVRCGRRKAMTESSAWCVRKSMATVPCRRCVSLRCLSDDDLFASLPRRVVNGFNSVYVGRPDAYANTAGHVAVSRMVMSRALGRLLASGEHVMHIDGNRLNDDITNLRLQRGSFR